MSRLFYAMSSKKYGLSILVMVCLSLNVYGAPVKENSPRAARWNHFVDNLYELHQHIVKSREVRTEEADGGYGGVMNDLNFYREVKYFDVKSGKLLSNIKWENKNPENIHVIELYIYDTSGRIKREYIAAYLPVHRNAPYQTLITLHHYEDGLHSFRQFDASNDHLYEQCRGKFFNQEVWISWDDLEIPDTVAQIKDGMQREVYRACFANLPKTAGPYTNPLRELPF